MKSILVVDDMAIFREPIAASLRSAGYDADCAADGEEALRIAREKHPDLILLDVAMPGMDGISFLRHLRSDPTVADIKVILLTVVSDKTRILAAGSLGVKDCILKTSFHLSDFLERIKKFEPTGSNPERQAGGDVSKGVATPPGEAPRLVSRDQMMERVERIFQAKTLSGVVAEVIATVNSARSDTAHLAALISRDPMLSARVLQAANSAMYSSTGAVVTTISDAIRKVGYTTVRNISTALGVFECMPEVSSDGFSPIRYWQHSFAVAQICERLSKAKLPDQAGLAYLVGLCHDLGEIFIHTEFGKEYQQVAEMSAQTGIPRAQLCGRMLGMTPAQMVGVVLKSMSLPDAIRQPIELINEPNGVNSKNPLVRILWMAENCANAAMMASSAISEVVPLSQTFCREAMGESHPRLPDPEAMRGEIVSMTLALAHMSRSDESKLLAPLFKRNNAKLWIARDSGVSEFDPVGLACQSLAEVEVSNRLPSEKELEACGGLLVLASSTAKIGFPKANIEAALSTAAKTGRSVPIMCLECEERVNLPGEPIPWRMSVSLAELAEFAQKLLKPVSAKAA